MTEFAYYAFGLGIQSCIELPELAAVSSCRTTIKVEMGAVNHGEAPMGWALDGGDVVLWWKDIAAFAVRPGQIILDLVPGCLPETVRLILLGSVFAVALQMAGYLVLHGNAILIGNAAIVLAGQKGSGKSTLTGALLARGHRLLSDDIAALRREAGGAFTVMPGFPAMKLWPDSLAHCGGLDQAARRPLAPDSNKLYLRLGAHQFADEPARLAALWVLEPGSVSEIAPMTGIEAFRQVLLHSYCSRYGQAVFRGPTAAAHLADCSALFGAARVEILRRSGDFASLEALAEMIESEAHAGRDAGRRRLSS